MKNINKVSRFAILAIALVFVISVTTTYSQTTKIDTYNNTFDDFKVKAEMWGDKVEDSNGNATFKNCRIKLFATNISDGSISNWFIEIKLRKDLKSSSYDSKKLRKGYIGKGSTQEFVFQDYCGMQGGTLKVYK